VDSDFSNRLDEALAIAGKTIRGFHGEISQGDVPGSSYPVIHRYLRGKTTPPIEFIDAAAGLLGVRRAWLAFGEGEPTEVEEATRGAGADATASDYAAVLEEAITEEFPPFANLKPWARSAVWEVVNRVARAEKARAHLLVEDDQERVDSCESDLVSAVMVAKSLRAPIEYLPPHYTTPDNFQTFVVSACAALTYLVSSPGARAAWERHREQGDDYPPWRNLESASLGGDPEKWDDALKRLVKIARQRDGAS